ncbi:unnamed protein product, partial [Mesorhabditis spiculigera]
MFANSCATTNCAEARTSDRHTTSTALKMVPPASIELPPAEERDPFQARQGYTEAAKRKALSANVVLLRDADALNFFIPECEEMTNPQLGRQLRNFHKQPIAPLLPDAVRHVVFEEGDVASVPKRRKAVNAINRALRECISVEDDGASTDYSDIELDYDEMDPVTLQYLDARRLLSRFQTTRIEDYIDELKRLRDGLEEQTQAHAKCTLEADAELETGHHCAKTRHWRRRYHADIIRAQLDPQPNVDLRKFSESAGTVARFAAVDDRVHAEISTGLDDVPFTRKSEALLHSLAIVPTATVRTRIDQSAWGDKDLVADEHSRCLPNPYTDDDLPDDGEQPGSFIIRFKPFRGGYGSDDQSDIYEESDEEYQLPKLRSGTLRVPQKKKRADGKHKNSAPARRFDIDDVILDYGTDNGIAGLPTNIEYKQIITPGFRPFSIPEELTMNVDPDVARREDSAHRNYLLTLHGTKLLIERRAEKQKKDAEAKAEGKPEAKRSKKKMRP